MINICCKACKKDKIYLLFAEKNPEATLWSADRSAFGELGRMEVACELSEAGGGEALFQLLGFQWMSENGAEYECERLPILKALKDMSAQEFKNLHSIRKKYSLAVITLSDKGAQGLRKDASGPEIIHILKDFMPISLLRSFLIPDEPGLLKALLADLALNQKFDLVCTTGGTGIGPRDITPQVTGSLLDLDLPGFAEAMMSASLAETANAMLSRARAGLIGHTLVLNLPGSPRAVRCNLQAVLPALTHALEKAGGDTSECGGK